MLNKIANSSATVGLVGLGYVGLPLAVGFGKRFKTIGFDTKRDRIEMLRKGIDVTLETSTEDMAAAEHLIFTDDPTAMAEVDIFIVTVPTPVDDFNVPDLSPLSFASEAIGKHMKKGAIVIYESTVYPGCTEEHCVPILERASGLRYNVDFFCGYSPERINPGDKTHTLTNIVKVTSGSTPEVAAAVDALYRTVVTAGTHRVSCIKVAEAAKVIENSQRDLNIAFVNELAKIFHLIGIDTTEVLEAAGTKWNFLHFRPGLVGGHCIGVDPYYLTHKAIELGYHPEVILAGRRINDGMGKFIAAEMVKLLIKKDIRVKGAKLLQLGITFKENCPDIRNSRAVDVVAALNDFDCVVDVIDPWASPDEVEREYGFRSLRELGNVDWSQYQGIILAVAHREFVGLTRDIIGADMVIYDIKSMLPAGMADTRL